MSCMMLHRMIHAVMDTYTDLDKGFEFGSDKDVDIGHSFCCCYIDHYSYNIDSCYTVDNFSEEYAIDNCSNSAH